MKITGKKIIITGAASGIGKALVQALHVHNTLFALDKDEESLQELQKKFPMIFIKSCDLLEDDAVTSCLKSASEVLGVIDICFSNAGFGYYQYWNIITPKQAKEVLTINTLVPMEFARQLKQSYPVNTPKLVITASAIAFWAIPGYSYYSASKAAIRQFAKGIWSEKDGDWLSLVHPVATKTSFFEKAGKDVPMAWPVQTADQVAAKILVGVSKGNKEIYPSRLFWASVQLNKLLPFIRPIYQNIQFSKLKKSITTIAK